MEKIGKEKVKWWGGCLVRRLMSRIAIVLLLYGFEGNLYGPTVSIDSSYDTPLHMRVLLLEDYLYTCGSYSSLSCIFLEGIRGSSSLPHTCQISSTITCFSIFLSLGLRINCKSHSLVSEKIKHSTI